MQKLLMIGAGGYIGSALLTRINNTLKNKYEITVIDLQGPNFNCPYDLVKQWAVGDYSQAIDYQDAHFWDVDTVLLFAGNSSVQNSTSLYPTFKNNVQNFAALINLLENKPKPPRFIYISSGSVYGNSPETRKETDLLTTPTNPYDTTKQIIDLIAGQSKLEYVGLRLGTVNGFSPNLRVDLMINSMLLSFNKKGYIDVSNTESLRPIMYIEDLVDMLLSLIETPIAPGVYNYHSFNMSIGDIALQVAGALDCPIKYIKGNQTYSFALDSSKLQNALNLLPTSTIGDIVDSLKPINWQYILQNETKHRRLRSYV